MSTMKDVREVLDATGKRISGLKVFEPAGTFGAINAAEQELQAKGYTVGSMCEDCPIAAAHHFERIAKWKNFSAADRTHIEALIISPDFRNEGCTIVYLENK